MYKHVNTYFYPSNLSPAGQELRSPPRRPRRRPRARRRQRRNLCLVPLWWKKEPKHWTRWKLKLATCLQLGVNGDGPVLCASSQSSCQIMPSLPKCNVLIFNEWFSLLYTSCFGLTKIMNPWIASCTRAFYFVYPHSSGILRVPTH